MLVLSLKDRGNASGQIFKPLFLPYVLLEEHEIQNLGN